MEMWGVGSFDNDDAMDWVNQLELAEDVSLIETTLKAITEDDEKYLEIRQCSQAIAASEVVLALVRKTQSDLPSEVTNWLSRQHLTYVDGEYFVQQALSALERIRIDSELKKMWDESDNGGDWHNAVGKLEARLESSLSPTDNGKSEQEVSSSITASGPTTPAPWSWYIPGIMALFFGVGGGAVVAYINFRRLEKTSDDILKQMGATVGLALLAVIVLIFLPFPSLAVNVVVGLIFLMYQKSDFEDWSRNNPERNPASWWRALGWAVLGAIIYLILVIIVLSILDIPLVPQSRNLRPLN